MEGIADHHHLSMQKAAALAEQRYGAAFARAYQAYYTRVFAFVYTRVRNVELTKDLVSQVFERAYLKGRGLREEAAYGAWLFMIARNLIAGHYRHLNRELHHHDRFKDRLRLAQAPPDPEDFALRDERISELMCHLRQLPERDQELLSLKFDADLTHLEIARVTGMKPLNVRVAIFRALRRLRACLQAQASQQ